MKEGVKREREVLNFREKKGKEFSVTVNVDSFDTTFETRLQVS